VSWLVAYTDVTQAADVIGKPAIVRGNKRFETLVASLDVGIVRMNDGVKAELLLYCLLREPGFQAHAYAHSTGTTVLHLAKDAIPTYEFAHPGLGLIRAFDDVARPCFARISANHSESATLDGLRDTLLPKLLSGELRVDQRGNQVAESA